MRFIRSSILLAFGVASTFQLNAQQSRLDSLDAYIKEQMSQRQIAGLSLAIINGGKIVLARGYGVVDKVTRKPVTPTTLFQAGSISKPVSALGALHLVEAGRLSLDGDVNKVLTSWHVPANDSTVEVKVTLRRILSHSAGLTVHGFPGYDVADQMPTLVQVLDGAKPANTAPIRVDTKPGSIWRYSGGGFTIMQQMIIDVTGMPFQRFMQETVLNPIRMTNSSFEQPQPPARAALTASGYYADRTPVRGRWHVYPEMAAAGLWTTPTDLAQFAIEIQQTLAGGGHGVISPSMARQYLTVQKGPSGLGIAVRDSGKFLNFNHGGRDEGFDASLFAYAESGDGVAIMINANDNTRLVGRIRDFIARAWGWPPDSMRAKPPVAVQGKKLDRARLAKYAGYYELEENQMITLVANSTSTGLETLVDGLPDRLLVALDSIRFYSAEEMMQIAFMVDLSGATTGLLWRPGEGPRERKASRVAPLPSAQKESKDADQNLTNRIAAALKALTVQGAALAAATDITAGAKKDFTGWNGHDLDGMSSLTFLGEENVSGRAIQRHGSPVERVRYYRMNTNARQRYILIHLASGGIVTDFDVVEK